VPTLTVTLPTLHTGVASDRWPGVPGNWGGQVEACIFTTQHRHTAITCGRRWGKTELLATIAADGAVKGNPIGIFAPDYKILSETYHELHDMLVPIKASASQIDGVIRCITGGRIDFWTLENERAGRSRKYKKVLIDEAAFGKANVTDIWERSIKPTLIDLRGSCIVASNTNGNSPDNFLYKICSEPKYGFARYQAPTHANPYLPVEELAELQAKNHPLVYAQENLAEFVDWSGVAFFTKDKLLVDGLPVPWPKSCETIFAVVDSAVKGGTEHDGTAVTWFAFSPHYGIPLIVLDWDIIQVDAALLERWIPSVFERGNELARICRARMGTAGVHIEDKESGSILLQQCALKGLQAYPLPAELTALGKDGRALNVGNAVYQGKVKFSEHAYNKAVAFKDAERNHLWSQVTGYRIGDKNAPKRADDLYDTFVYGIGISLGDSTGVTA
jgi:hypothetical protein